MSDKFRRKKEPKHIRLYASITSSEAWKHLSGNAVKVLLALVARDDGTRNGNIGFSVREAADQTGLGERTCWRCLIELQEKGFIACTQKGGFNRKVLHSSLWRYTWQAWPGGTPAAPSRDFEKWRCTEIRGCKICHRTVVVSDEPSGNTTAPVADIATEEPAINGNVRCFHLAETTTLTINQGDRGGALETEQRKQASPISRADLGALRDWTLAHLQRHEPGEQSRLAKDVRIPAGTLSKFINGGNLPEQYRGPLAAAVAIY